jgi:hypothetical protein
MKVTFSPSSPPTSVDLEGEAEIIEKLNSLFVGTENDHTAVLAESRVTR